MMMKVSERSARIGCKMIEFTDSLLESEQRIAIAKFLFRILKSRGVKIKSS